MSVVIVVIHHSCSVHIKPTGQTRRCSKGRHRVTYFRTLSHHRITNGCRACHNNAKKGCNRLSAMAVVGPLLLKLEVEGFFLAASIGGGPAQGTTTRTPRGSVTQGPIVADSAGRGAVRCERAPTVIEGAAETGEAHRAVSMAGVVAKVE